MGELSDIPDYSLLDAVDGLVKVYETMGRSDDCVRLTTAQAKRLAALARKGYYAD